MSRRRPWAPGAALALALLACAGRDGESGPPAFAWGLDECSRCRMIVSEAAFAAALVAADGRVDRYDDVGCLLAALYEAAADPEAAGAVWVHDRPTGQPLPAASAWFVRLPGGATPMGSGWVAFADRETAAAVAADAGVEAARWAAVRGSGVATTR